MQFESLLPASRLSLPAAARNLSLSRAAQTLWSSVSLGNRSGITAVASPASLPPATHPTEDASNGCQPAQHSEANDLNAGQLEDLQGIIGQLELRLRDPALEDGERIQLISQLSRLQGLIAAPASPKETSKFSMISLTSTASAGVQGMVARLSDIGRASPDQSNAIALPCSTPVVTTTQTSPTLRSTSSALVNSVISLVQTNLQWLNQKVNQSVARQEEINSTAEPPAHTQLEKLCHFERTSSAATRQFKPANSTLIIRALKKSGFEFNPNAGSYGPLHLAVASGHPGRVSALLNTCKGYIDVDRVSPFFGKTALGKAVENGDHVCAGLLLAADAAPRTEDFALAAERGDVRMFRMLYQQLSQREHRGGIDLHPALHTAVTANHLEIARHLLENGVKLDPRNNEGLLDAAYKGHIEMIRLLLLHAPQGYLEPSDSSKGESYPLIQAALGANLEAVTLLLASQTNRQFVHDMVDAINRSLQSRSLFDQNHYRPVINCLEAWLQGTATAVGSSSAIASASVQTRPMQDATEASAPAHRSSRVFRPSHALSGAGMRLY